MAKVVPIVVVMSVLFSGCSAIIQYKHLDLSVDKGSPALAYGQGWMISKIDSDSHIWQKRLVLSSENIIVSIGVSNANADSKVLSWGPPLIPIVPRTCEWFSGLHLIDDTLEDPSKRLTISIGVSSLKDRHETVSIQPRKIRIGIGDPTDFRSPVLVGGDLEGLEKQNIKVGPKEREFYLVYVASERDLKSLRFYIEGIETKGGPLNVPRVELASRSGLDYWGLEDPWAINPWLSDPFVTCP